VLRSAAQRSRLPRPWLQPCSRLGFASHSRGECHGFFKRWQGFKAWPSSQPQNTAPPKSHIDCPHPTAPRTPLRVLRRNGPPTWGPLGRQAPAEGPPVSLLKPLVNCLPPFSLQPFLFLSSRHSSLSKLLSFTFLPPHVCTSRILFVPARQLNNPTKFNSEKFRTEE